MSLLAKFFIFIHYLPSIRVFGIGMMVYIACTSVLTANELESEQAALNQIAYLSSLNGKEPKKILEQLTVIANISQRQAWQESAFLAEVMRAELFTQIADYKSAEDITKVLLPVLSNNTPEDVALRLRLVELMLKNQRGYSDQALILEQEILQSILFVKDDVLKVNMLLKVAYIQYLGGRFNDATKSYYMAYSSIENTDNQDALGHILVALGNIYSKQKNYESSLDYYTRAMTIAESLEQSFGIAVTAYNIGFIYFEMGDLTQASENLLKASSAYKAVKSQIGVAQASNMLGRIALKQERWSDAIELFQTALPTFEDSGNTLSVFRLHLDLIRVYLSLQDTDNAEIHFKRSESLLSQIQDKPSVQQFYDIASTLKAQLADYESAYIFAKKVAPIQNLVHEENVKQDAQRSLVEFNAQITEARNKVLESANELQALKLQQQDNAFRLSIVIAVLILFLFIASSVLAYFIARNRNHFKNLALIDHLTNAPNRRAILESAAMYFENAKFNNGNLAIGILDLDKFKDINDNFGHDSGDAVLKTFAEKCKQSLRGQDNFGRYGGEEWMMVLDESSPQNIEKIFERLRALLNDADIKGLQKDYSITFSMGVAIYQRELDKSISQLIKRADNALYEAKKSGRDKIIFL